MKKFLGVLLTLPAILFLLWLFIEAYRIGNGLFAFLVAMTSIPMAAFGIFMLTEKK